MSFSVADSKSRKTESGDWETLAEQWLECTIWGSLAEHYDGKLTKGSRVTVYGDFMSRKYEAKDGSEGTSLDVNVKGVDIMPSRNGNGSSQTANRSNGGAGGSSAQEDPWATPAPRLRASLLTMKTRPRGIHATFTTECANCGGELTITSGRPDPHDCHPVTLAQLRAALDAKN